MLVSRIFIFITDATVVLDCVETISPEACHDYKNSRLSSLRIGKCSCVFENGNYSLHYL